MLNEIINRLDKRTLILLSILLIAVVAGEIVLTALIPAWRQYFYDVLQGMHQSLFLESVLYFFLLMAGLGTVQGLKAWIGQLLSFNIRKTISKMLLKKWTKNPVKVDNYTQAQTEALKNATSLYLEIVVEVVISASIVIMLMWMNRHETTILLASIGYTIVASLMAMIFNQSLINSDAACQNAEGNYREAIGDIANGNGDYSSKNKFIELSLAYYKYIKILMYYTLSSRLKSSISSVVPYLLLANQYFSGSITLGVFMNGVATFELIVINATILLVLYPNLTKARASYKIVKDFYTSIN